MLRIGFLRVAVSDGSRDITKDDLFPRPRGRRELPFEGGFEDGSFVAFEVGLDAFEVGNGFVEAGELLFDLRDDVILLPFWCSGKCNFLKN